MRNFLVHAKKTWLQISCRRKILIIIFLSLLIIGLVLSVSNIYQKFTVIQPKEGGTLKLGIIGHPLYINPVLSSGNDCDNKLEELIYNGLYSVDGKGNLIPQLAKKTEISPDGKTYTIFLKNNVLWHDGVKFTADDVIFTIQTIQNPKFKSPLYLNWTGVTVEKIGKDIIRFRLSNPYHPFLQNLTLKIIPAHIWKNIPPELFPLAQYNLKPIGTGPYIFDNLEKTKRGEITSYTLAANKNYFAGPAKIEHLILRFYNSYQQAKRGLLKGEIDGLSPLAPQDVNFFQSKRNFQIQRLELPRYYAVFFNLNKNIFTKEVREALDLSISRSQLIKEVLNNQALPLSYPISPGFWGSINATNDYSSQQARNLLKKEITNGNSLHFTLTLPDDPQLVKVASFLKKSWQGIGVRTELQILPLDTLEKDIIPHRSYEALLFGEIVGQDPDLFSFWHSSQAISPGLNLSAYRNQNLDKLLEETRQISDENKRKENIILIQKILGKDKPAIFLYNPYVLYLLPSSVKGNSVRRANYPAEYLADINHWYIYTSRHLHF